MTNQEEKPIDGLPLEIWHQIFIKLKLIDHLKLRKTDKEHKKIVDKITGYFSMHPIYLAINLRKFLSEYAKLWSEDKSFAKLLNKFGTVFKENKKVNGSSSKLIAYKDKLLSGQMTHDDFSVLLKKITTTIIKKEKKLLKNKTLIDLLKKYFELFELCDKSLTAQNSSLPIEVKENIIDLAPTGFIGISKCMTVMAIEVETKKLLLTFYLQLSGENLFENKTYFQRKSILIQGFNVLSDHDKLIKGLFDIFSGHHYQKSLKFIPKLISAIKANIISTDQMNDLFVNRDHSKNNDSLRKEESEIFARCPELVHFVQISELKDTIHQAYFIKLKTKFEEACKSNDLLQPTHQSQKSM